jgi:YVTN family beta-propeller protein
MSIFVATLVCYNCGKSGFIFNLFIVIIIVVSLILFSSNNTSAQNIDPMRETNTQKSSTDIKVGLSPVAIDVDEERNKIYVVNRDSIAISVIDGDSGNTTNDIRVGTKPLDVKVVGDTNKIYVSSHRSNIVSVIDGLSDDVIIRDLGVGKNPNNIASIARVEYNKIYVANEGSGTVSVINGSNDKKVGDIPILVKARVLPFLYKPINVAVNPSTNKIYVANIHIGSARKPVGTVSVIDGFSDKKIDDISVGSRPTDVAVNIDKNKIYVANTDSGTVSVIDGFSDKIAAGVTFDVNPTNSGTVICNNGYYPIKQYLYVPVGTRCMAKPNKDFEFNSWIENLGHKCIKLWISIKFIVNGFWH